MCPHRALGPAEDLWGKNGEIKILPTTSFRPLKLGSVITPIHWLLKKPDLATLDRTSAVILLMSDAIKLTKVRPK